MKKTIIFIAILLSITIGTKVMAFEGTAVKTLDASTLIVEKDDGTLVHVKLYGIDTPSTNQQYGFSSKDFIDKSSFHKPLLVDDVVINKYNRIEGIVSVDGIVLNQELVERGYAWVSLSSCNIPICDSWLQREEHARNQKNNIWKGVNSSFSLKGIVTNSKNQSVAGAKLSLFDKHQNAIASATTDWHGEYLFNVPPGKYYIAIHHLNKTTRSEVIIEPGNNQLVKNFTLAVDANKISKLFFSFGPTILGAILGLLVALGTLFFNKKKSIGIFSEQLCIPLIDLSKQLAKLVDDCTNNHMQYLSNQNPQNEPIINLIKNIKGQIQNTENFFGDFLKKYLPKNYSIASSIINETHKIEQIITDNGEWLRSSQERTNMKKLIKKICEKISSLSK
jgi:endonuclease YncB( thermonuclease family)